MEFASKLLDALVPPLDVAVEFFAVVVVIRERGMDLPEREMRMLEMKLLGTPSVCPLLDDEIHDLHPRPDDARNPALVHFNMLVSRLMWNGSLSKRLRMELYPLGESTMRRAKMEVGR